MSTLTKMLDHHLWLSGQILDRAGGLGDDVLDLPIRLSVEGIDSEPLAWPRRDRDSGRSSLGHWMTAAATRPSLI
jgi:hypothetical protein